VKVYNGFRKGLWHADANQQVGIHYSMGGIFSLEHFLFEEDSICFMWFLYIMILACMCYFMCK
jgi:hypothetical protein